MKCYNLKTIILGDCGVGKTSILYKYYNGNDNHENESTVGVNFVSKLVDKDKYNDIIKLQIWDTAGQERFRSIIKTYYRNVCACVITYDITNKTSFQNSMYWINEIRQNNDSAKIIIVGNKTDLEDKRKVSFEDGLKLSNYYKAPFFEVSSRDCVDNIFEKLVDLVMEEVDYDIECETETSEKRPLMNGIIMHDSIELHNKTDRNIVMKSLTYLGCCNN